MLQELKLLIREWQEKVQMRMLSEEQSMIQRMVSDLMKESGLPKYCVDRILAKPRVVEYISAAVQDTVAAKTAGLLPFLPSTIRARVGRHFKFVSRATEPLREIVQPDCVAFHSCEHAAYWDESVAMCVAWIPLGGL